MSYDDRYIILVDEDVSKEATADGEASFREMTSQNDEKRGVRTGFFSHRVFVSAKAIIAELRRDANLRATMPYDRYGQYNSRFR